MALRVEMCATWKRAPVSCASRISRATITPSEQDGMPRRPSRTDHGPAADLLDNSNAMVGVNDLIANVENAGTIHGGPSPEGRRTVISLSDSCPYSNQ